MSNQIPDPRQWCDDLQIKLMAVMDAAWRVAETSADPAEVAKALARAKLCGQFAANARKVAALAPTSRGAEPARSSEAKTPAAPARLEVQPLDPDAPPLRQADIARAALDRLRSGGGRRGRP
jgi:hypothetical protein